MVTANIIIRPPTSPPPTTGDLVNAIQNPQRDPGLPSNQGSTPVNNIPSGATVINVARPSGGGGGGGGGSSSGSQATTTNPVVDVTTSTTSSTPTVNDLVKGDVLGGFNPVYSGSNLLGFQSPTGVFIPKETATTQAGLYRPQDVKPNVITGKGEVESYQNLSGGGSTKITKQGDTTYTTAQTAQGNIKYQSTVSATPQVASKGLVSDLTNLGFTSEQINRALEVVKNKGSPTADIKDAVDIINQQIYGGVSGEVRAPTNVTKEQIAYRAGSARADKLLSPIISGVRRLAEGIPTYKDFFGIDLSKLGQTNEDKNSPIVFETTPTMGGKGTNIVTTREKTFYENLGIKENAPAITLKNTYDSIQNDYQNNKLTDVEAQAKIDQAFKTYTTSQAVRDLPKNIALGTALVAINAIAPPIGKAVDVAFIGDAVLRRNELLESLRKYPAAFAIQTGGLIAGGLVGSVGAKAISRNLKAPEINVENFDSLSRLAGKERTQAIQTAVESASKNIQGMYQEGKITANNVFDTITKDGRQVTIVTFSKLKAEAEGAMKGNDVIIGYEKLKGADAINRKFIGQSQTTATPEGSKSYIQGYTFKIAEGRVAKILQELGFKDKPMKFEILEESKVLKTQGDINARTTDIQTQSRILKSGAVSRELARKIISIQDKLNKGFNPTISEIKSLINLELRANEKVPFTDKEWRQSNIGQLTETQIRSILERADAKVKAIENEVGRLKSIRTDVRTQEVGVSKTKGIEIKKQAIAEKVVERKIKTTEKEKGMSLKEFEKNIQTRLKSQSLFDRLEATVERATRQPTPKEKLMTMKEFAKKIQNEFAGSRLQRKEPIARPQRESTTMSEFKSRVQSDLKSTSLFDRLESAVGGEAKAIEVKTNKPMTMKQFSKRVDVTFKNSGESDLKAPIDSGQRGTTSLLQLKENVAKRITESRADTLRNLKAKGTSVLLAFTSPVKKFFSPKEIIKTASPSLLVPKTSFSEFPRIVQAGGKATGSFSNKGTYERTEVTSFGNVKPTTRTGSSGRTNLKTNITQLDIQKPREELTQRPRDRLTQSSFTKSNYSEKLREAQKNAQEQLQQFKQQQRLQQKQSSFTRQSPRELIKPIIKISPKVPSILGKPEKRKEFKKDLRKQGFVAFVKEKGKFERVGKEIFKTKEEALGFGFAKAKSNLSRSVIALKATGNVKESTLARAEYNKFKKEFRPSKQYGSSVAVQINALSNKRETELIQKAKQLAEQNKPFKRRGAPPIRSIK
jgi:hypothetical protein